MEMVNSAETAQRMLANDVKMDLISESSTHIKAEVSTPLGVARLALDFSSDECVVLKAVLPSGQQYEKIYSFDSWPDDADEESERYNAKRLMAGFVVWCFREDASAELV